MLWISTYLASGIALGIVFLMTTKPNWLISLLVVAVTIALGGIIGAMMAKPRQSSATVAAQQDFEKTASH
jgi:small basic protein